MKASTCVCSSKAIHTDETRGALTIPLLKPKQPMLRLGNDAALNLEKRSQIGSDGADNLITLCTTCIAVNTI
jgi:hypothetical protein